MSKLKTYRVVLPTREWYVGEVHAANKREALEKAREHIHEGDGQFTVCGGCYHAGVYLLGLNDEEDNHD